MMSVINLCVMMVSCAFYCCVSWSQAPFTPFITELMYQNLRHLIDPASVEEKDSGSIHYLMLPHVRCTALHFRHLIAISCPLPIRSLTSVRYASSHQGCIRFLFYFTLKCYLFLWSKLYFQHRFSSVTWSSEIIDLLSMLKSLCIISWIKQHYSKWKYFRTVYQVTLSTIKY